MTFSRLALTEIINKLFVTEIDWNSSLIVFTHLGYNRTFIFLVKYEKSLKNDRDNKNFNGFKFYSRG